LIWTFEQAASSRIFPLYAAKTSSRLPGVWAETDRPADMVEDDLCLGKGAGAANEWRRLRMPKTAMLTRSKPIVGGSGTVAASAATRSPYSTVEPAVPEGV
jgi:hypothetical protein